MRTLIAAAIVALVAPTANAALMGSFVEGAKNVAVVDPGTFQPSSPVDLYEVRVENGLTSPVAALEFRIEGTFVNNPAASGVAFKEGTSLPAFGPFSLADTFFVLPAGSAASNLPAPGQTVDTSGVLAAAWTLAGAPRLIPAGETYTVAVLAVPAGAAAPDASNIALSRAAVDGAFAEITFGEVIPEPTTCILAGLALVGVAARRRV